MFQPSHDARWNQANDFSLWRAITREMSEELLGSDENYHSDVRPIDYQQWPFYNALESARQAGTLRLYWLGLGIDPLTLVADMLTVAVFDAPLFDRTFTSLVAANDEGHFLTDGRPDGRPSAFRSTPPPSRGSPTPSPSSRPALRSCGPLGSSTPNSSPCDRSVTAAGGLVGPNGAAGAQLDPQLPVAGSRRHESGSGWGTWRRGSRALRRCASGSGKAGKEVGVAPAIRRARVDVHHPPRSRLRLAARRRRLGAPGCGSRWRLAFIPATRRRFVSCSSPRSPPGPS